MLYHDMEWHRNEWLCCGVSELIACRDTFLSFAYRRAVGHSEKIGAREERCRAKGNVASAATRNDTSRIVDACKDPLFWLEFDSSTEVVSLKMVCNHYQLVGQLVISGAWMGYFAVWTWRDMFIAEIKPNADHCSSLLCNTDLQSSILRTTERRLWQDCCYSK